MSYIYTAITEIVGVRLMNSDDFERECNYLLTMSHVRQLKEKGVISEEDYKKIDTMLLKKYRPVISALLSGNSPE